jgi:lipopolysaccharide transport system ATP-binding protein
MSDSVIKVENLSKRYFLSHLADKREQLFSRLLVNKAKSLFGRGKKVLSSPFATHHSPSTGSQEEFWALNDVSFEIKQGDRIGIIGRNGAGKSTLLKVLSRITEPTKGRITIDGRVASLLEVGTGFHSELTGRENIYLNGAILGMSREEIKRKFDEIVDFAEVDKFLDTPVKRYSSGMYVRLAFAVAAHLEPEILIVDEVLAVGDAQFQKKCLGKMEDVSTKEGRTVLFVSHNMGAIRQLCSRAILLKNGHNSKYDTVDAIIHEYLKSDMLSDTLDHRCFYGTLKSIIEFNAIKINGENSNDAMVSPLKPLTLMVYGVCNADIQDFRITFSIYNNDLRLITQHDTLTPKILKKGKFTSEITFQSCILRPGEYTIAIGGHTGDGIDWIFGTFLKRFTVIEEWSVENPVINIGLINVPILSSKREYVD